MKRLEELTDWLHSFNNWRDDFLIEASTLLLMVGFIMGTVDLLIGGGVVTQSWFTVSWAIVQAIAIDGLFFAVWGKIARSHWEKGYRLRLLAMVFVGLLLAMVAMLVNDVLSYQQVANIANSFTAMRTLHISSVAFVWTRAILVVAVALLVQLFCRGKREQEATPIAPTAITEEVSPSTVAPSRAMIVESHSPSQEAIPEHSSLDRVEAMQEKSTDSPDGYVAIEETTAMHHSVAIVAVGSQGYRDKIKSTWLRHIQEGREIKLTDIAQDAGVGYSTVKKWASSIREEIEQEKASGRTTLNGRGIIN